MFLMIEFLQALRRIGRGEGTGLQTTQGGEGGGWGYDFHVDHRMVASLPTWKVCTLPSLVQVQERTTVVGSMQRFTFENSFYLTMIQANPPLPAL